MPRSIVRIRLQRFGKPKTPYYRIVAAFRESPRDGRHLEVLGTYNPIACNDGVKEIRYKSQRVKYWLSVGAKPSERVDWLLSKGGLLPPKPNRQSTLKSIPKAMRPKRSMTTSAAVSVECIPAKEMRTDWDIPTEILASWRRHFQKLAL